MVYLLNKIVDTLLLSLSGPEEVEANVEMMPIDVSEDSEKIPSPNVKSAELGIESDEEITTVEPYDASTGISSTSKPGGVSLGVISDTISTEENEKHGITPFSDYPIETIKEEEDPPPFDYLSKHRCRHNYTAPVEEFRSHNIDDVIFEGARSQFQCDSNSSLTMG